MKRNFLNIISFIVYKFKKFAILAVIMVFAVGCIDTAPNVVGYPASQSSPTQELGALMPRIQLVYPGTLQTLDIPVSYPTDINPDGASIVVVFSHVMENDGNNLVDITDDGEMAQNFILFKDSANIPMNIDPSGASSKSFAIHPTGEDFQGDTVYTLRIYKFANVDDDPNRILDFENLIETPATTLNPINPDYVDYTYRTGPAGTVDNQPPVVLSSNPADADINVDPTLAPTGYIEIVFSDNMVPMIYPSTVNMTTINLVNITDGFPTFPPIPIIVDMDSSDLDFKTYTVTPQVPLLAFKQYCLTISPDGIQGETGNNIVEDFRGNYVNRTEVYFNTAP